MRKMNTCLLLLIADSFLFASRIKMFHINNLVLKLAKEILNAHEK